MRILQYVEYGLGTVLSYARGHDSALIINSPPFAGVPESIEVTCEIGPSGSNMSIEHTGNGSEGKKDIFPRISWSAPAAVQSQTKEYLVLVEDPDAPIPPRILEAVHGVLYGISPSKTSIVNEDLEPMEGGTARGNELKGGFKYGRMVRPFPYLGPKPPVGHGSHRYFYQVAALKEPIDDTNLSKLPTKAEIVKEIDGKVLAWGAWIGNYETPWR